MKLEHSFTVPVGVDEAWKILLDIERIGPCMPGATIESVDGDDFTGSVKVKLGAINLTYKGKASFIEKDEVAHRAVIDAKGRDSRGSGTAAAKVTAVLTEDTGSTKVVVETDLDVTGKVAQFGRGVMADVGNKLIGQFADCLATTITSDASADTAQLPAAGQGDQPSGAAADTAPVKKTATKSATKPATRSATKSAARSETTAAAKKARPKPSKAQPAAAAAESPAAAAAAEPSEPSAGATTPEEATAALPEQPVVEESALDAVAEAPGYSAPAEEPAAPAAEAAAEPSVNGHSAARQREVEPINLLEQAGPAVAKRLAPPLVVALLVVLFVVLRRRNAS